MNDILTVENLDITFRGRRRGQKVKAVENVSLTVSQGETFGVIGETGGPLGVRAAGATPGGQVAVLLTTGAGSSRVPNGNPCAGTVINLNSSLTLAQLARADAQGRLTLGPVHVPPAPAG